MSADDVNRRLGNLIRNLPGAVARALYEEAEIEMTEAKQRTPVDQGNLRDSGIVEQPVIAGQEITVRLAFGGPAAPYALFVHEDLDAFHTVGQAKYLESVITESAPHMADRIVRQLDLEALSR